MPSSSRLATNNSTDNNASHKNIRLWRMFLLFDRRSDDINNIIDGHVRFD